MSSKQKKKRTPHTPGLCSHLLEVYTELRFILLRPKIWEKIWVVVCLIQGGPSTVYSSFIADPQIITYWAIPIPIVYSVPNAILKSWCCTVMLINNGNSTESSPIWSVIIGVINKIR